MTDRTDTDELRYVAKHFPKVRRLTNAVADELDAKRAELDAARREITVLRGVRDKAIQMLRSDAAEQDRLRADCTELKQRLQVAYEQIEASQRTERSAMEMWKSRGRSLIAAESKVASQAATITAVRDHLVPKGAEPPEWLSAALAGQEPSNG